MDLPITVTSRGMYSINSVLILWARQRIHVVNCLTLLCFPSQAREDVIHMLKTEKTKPEVLEAHYGSAEPEKVLRVLHRDAILAQEKSIGEDVYEKPISEVKTHPHTSRSWEPQREFSILPSDTLQHFLSKANIYLRCPIPWWLRWWRNCLQCRRPGFDPWVGKIPCRREWQPTPVFLPGEYHGQRSLVGYSPRGYKESDKTEGLTLSLSI